MLYDNVKRICTEKGTSVGKVEKALGFSNGSISKWNESVPGIYRVKEVANHLGVTVDELLADKEKEVG